MSKLRIILGGKVYKRSAMGGIKRDDRVEWVNPFRGDDTEIVTYYVTWVIIDGRRVDIQRLGGCRFWIRYDPGLDQDET